MMLSNRMTRMLVCYPRRSKGPLRPVPALTEAQREFHDGLTAASATFSLPDSAKRLSAQAGHQQGSAK